LINDLYNVCSRLPLNVNDNRRRTIHPCRLLYVFGIINGISHVRQLHGCAITIGDNQGLIFLAREKLIVGVNNVGQAGAVEASFGLVDIGSSNGDPQVFQSQPIGSQRHRIGMDPHSRSLSAADAHQPYSRELGNFLRKSGIREVLHLCERHGFRGQAKRQDRGVSRIYFAVHRRNRKISRQIGEGGIYCSLDLLLRNIEA